MPRRKTSIKATTTQDEKFMQEEIEEMECFKRKIHSVMTKEEKELEKFLDNMKK